MADIAAAVGVSRQTIYNEFGGKDELARALLLREASRFLGQVEAALADHPGDPVGGLGAAFEVFLRIANSEPLAISHVALPTAEPQVAAARVTQVFVPYLLQLTRTR